MVHVGQLAPVLAIPDFQEEHTVDAEAVTPTSPLAAHQHRCPMPIPGALHGTLGFTTPEVFLKLGWNEHSCLPSCVADCFAGLLVLVQIEELQD